MPIHSLVDKSTRQTIKIRRMSHSAAEVLNKELTEQGDDHEWKLGLDPGRTPPPVGSLSMVLRGLDAEGFNEYTMNAINRWFRRDLRQRNHRQVKHDTAKARFVAFMREQKDEDRKAVGKFMSIQEGRAFQAGIQLGLAGRVFLDTEVDDFVDQLGGV